MWLVLVCGLINDCGLSLSYTIKIFFLIDFVLSFH